MAAGKITEIINSAKEIGGVKVAVARFDGTAPDELKKTAETVKANYADAVVVLAAVNGEKLTFCAACTEDGYTGDTVCAACGKDALSKGAHAGNLVREVAKAAGGNGGGKPDLAMAGGKDIAAVDKALGTAEQVITAQIGV